MDDLERSRLETLQMRAARLWATLRALAALTRRISDLAALPNAPPGRGDRWGNDESAAAELADSLVVEAAEITGRLDPTELSYRMAK